jgi:hypothetical protein
MRVPIAIPARKEHPHIPVAPSIVQTTQIVKSLPSSHASPSSLMNLPSCLSKSLRPHTTPEYNNVDEFPLRSTSPTASSSSVLPVNHRPNFEPQSSPLNAVPETNVNKPLVGLASLLDGFLVTARNATQMQAPSYPDIQQRSVKRKRGPVLESNTKIPTVNHGPNAASRSTFMKPINSSLRSFVRTSVRNSQLSSPIISGQVHTPDPYRPLRTLTAQSQLHLPSVKSLFSNSASLLGSTNSQTRNLALTSNSQEN